MNTARTGEGHERACEAVTLTPGRLFAVIVAVTPLVVEIAITVAWWDRVPDRIPTTFGPEGRPTGYGTRAGTAILFAAVQALFSAAAIGSAFARDHRKGRVACAITTGYVAALCIGWLLIIGFATSSLLPAAWWLLATAPAWACLPLWLLAPGGTAARRSAGGER